MEKFFVIRECYFHIYMTRLAKIAFSTGGAKININQKFITGALSVILGLHLIIIQQKYPTIFTLKNQMKADYCFTVRLCRKNIPKKSDFQKNTKSKDIKMYYLG